MKIDLPADASSFVETLISTGAFQTPGDVVAEGIRLLASREKLRAEVQAGIDDANAGNLVDANEVYAEARKRIQSQARKG
jgi:putative addiction module CopG family antidote